MYVVDTNVFVSVDHPDALPNCASACASFLEGIITTGDQIFVDDKFQILGEYRNNLGNNDTATEFLNLLQGGSGTGVEYLSIVQTNAPSAALPGPWFSNLPNVPQILKSDPSDRKFIATALEATHRGMQTTLVFAADSKWCNLLTQLTTLGVQILDLCNICQALQSTQSGRHKKNRNLHGKV